MISLSVAALTSLREMLSDMLLSIQDLPYEYALYYHGQLDSLDFIALLCGYRWNDDLGAYLSCFPEVPHE